MAETALQLFSRLGVKEQLGDLDMPFFSQLSAECHGLKPGDVIEFCGIEGTGKSEVLYNIVAGCVLPKKWQGEKLGREVEVIFISTDSKFDLVRLTAVIEGHISNKLGTSVNQEESAVSDEYKEMVLSSLSRVYVIHCNSSNELTVTLQSLKSFLHSHSRVCALMVDNVAAYYWMDKDKGEACQHHWITSLNELIHDYHLTVFASKALIFHRHTGRPSHRETKVNKSTFSNDFMPKLWQKLVKYRFHLELSDFQVLLPVFCILLSTHLGQVYRFHVCENGLMFL